MSDFIKFLHYEKKLVVDFELKKTGIKELDFNIEGRIETELLKIKGIIKVNLCMATSFECYEQKYKDIEREIHSRVKVWYTEELNMYIYKLNYIIEDCFGSGVTVEKEKQELEYLYDLQKNLLIERTNITNKEKK